MKKQNRWAKAIAIFIMFCVHVSMPVKLSISSGVATAYVGKTFLVSCQDESGRSVSWTGPNGRTLGPKTRPKVDNASYGKVIFFENIQQNDSGVYMCSAGHDKSYFNFTVVGPALDDYMRPGKRDRKIPVNRRPPIGDISYPSSYITEEPITIKDTHPIQYGEEGEDTPLRCEATGDDIKIFWVNETNHNLLPPKFELIGDGIVVRNVSKEDTGIYFCRIMQMSTGDMKNQKIMLKVKHKPYPVRERQEYLWGYIGGQLNLTCEVTGEPIPRFAWYKNHRRIDRGITERPFISVLTLNFDGKHNFGTYTCNATNEMGKEDIIFVVQQGEKPKPPEFIELKGENNNLLTIGVQHEEEVTRLNGMEPIGYLIEYRPKNEVEWQFTELPVSTENAYHLLDLKPDTMYEVKVASRNVAGVSDFTDSSYFQTLKDEKPNAAANFCLASSLTLATTSILISLYSW